MKKQPNWVEQSTDLAWAKRAQEARQLNVKPLKVEGDMEFYDELEYLNYPKFSITASFLIMEELKCAVSLKKQ